MSCIVVAYRRPQSLALLLDALVHPMVERIAVVIEGSPDLVSIAIARDARVVLLSGNPGYAAAVNVGVVAASAPAVVFMNDDLLVRADQVLKLSRIVMTGAADVAVPRLIALDGTTEPTVAPLLTPASLALEWLALPDHPVPWLQNLLIVQKWRRPELPETVPAAMAAIVACRRTLLEDVPLPEEYFLYWEESEWFWWLAHRGTRVVMEPSIAVRHDGGRGDIRPAKSRLLARNAVRCVRRTQGRAAAGVSWLIVVAWNVRLLAVDAMRAAAGRGRKMVLPARWAGLLAAIAAAKEVW